MSEIVKSISDLIKEYIGVEPELFDGYKSIDISFNINIEKDRELSSNTEQRVKDALDDFFTSNKIFEEFEQEHASRINKLEKDIFELTAEKEEIERYKTYYELAKGLVK